MKCADGLYRGPEFAVNERHQAVVWESTARTETVAYRRGLDRMPSDR